MELGVLKPAPANLPILAANSPDIDYPYTVIPPQLTSCGPIVRVAPHIREVGPDLAAWLSRRPTIYINLGTHHKSNANEAHEMAKALKIVLDEGDAQKSKERPLRILWKLGRTADAEGNIPQRDKDWLVAGPKSVIESKSIVCFVNHGGANSFHEGLCTGIPQVLLPAWTDC
ncbi:hypothetical protein FSST1_012714 [Fusarium sambucinum]